MLHHRSSKKNILNLFWYQFCDVVCSCLRWVRHASSTQNLQATLRRGECLPFVPLACLIWRRSVWVLKIAKSWIISHQHSSFCPSCLISRRTVWVLKLCKIMKFVFVGPFNIKNDVSLGGSCRQLGSPSSLGSWRRHLASVIVSMRSNTNSEKTMVQQRNFQAERRRLSNEMRRNSAINDIDLAVMLWSQLCLGMMAEFWSCSVWILYDRN